MMKPLSLPRPHLIIMVGIPGAGKSFFADHFATTFQTPIINRSQLVRTLFGASSVDTTTNAVVNKVVASMLTELFKTNQTVIYEGQAASKTARNELIKIALKAGYAPLFIWVQTESYEAKRRATKLSKDATALTAEQFDQAIDQFDVPSPAEHAIVISGKHTYASQLKIVLKHLTSTRALIKPTSTPRQTPPTRNITVR